MFTTMTPYEARMELHESICDANMIREDEPLTVGDYYYQISGWKKYIVEVKDLIETDECEKYYNDLKEEVSRMHKEYIGLLSDGGRDYMRVTKRSMEIYANLLEVVALLVYHLHLRQIELFG